MLSPQQLVKVRAESQRNKSLPRVYTFGNRNDNAIDYARNWANKRMNGKAIHYDNPDTADPQLLNQIDATPLSIIVGHGISDARASAVA